MKIFQAFIIGLGIIPALLGTVLIIHVFIKPKYDNDGEEITNRIARLELVWLAMNKPRMFCEDFPWVCQNVQERHAAPAPTRKD